MRRVRHLSDPTFVVPRVLAIVDYDYAGSTTKWLETIRRLSDLPNDPSIGVQVRVKSQTGSDLLDLATQAQTSFKNEVVYFGWNGSLDICRRAGYKACHHPEHAIEIVGCQLASVIQSASVHSTNALRHAEKAGVSFAIFAPVFQPKWKTVKPSGLSGLKGIVEQAAIPIIALGGITEDDLPQINASGAHGFGLLSQVMDATDPVNTIMSMQYRWNALH